jgi:hypothetical protein
MFTCKSTSIMEIEVFDLMEILIKVFEISAVEIENFD